MLIARMRTLCVEEGDKMTTAVKISAQNSLHSLSRSLFKSVEDLDQASISSTLSILAKGTAGPVDLTRPDDGKLHAIE